MQCSIPILMCGNYDCGKSTIIQLLLNYNKNSTLTRALSTEAMNQPSGDSLQRNKSGTINFVHSSKLTLPIKSTTKEWTGVLKSGLVNVRREGQNMLLNIGEKDVIITVDDLDLGR